MRSTTRKKPMNIEPPHNFSKEMNIVFHGKMKAITFSYDDGVKQDERLVELLNKYNLKATFNLNSELLGSPEVKDGERFIAREKIKPEDVRNLYAGHEVSVHTLTHPNLVGCTDQEIIYQIETDRQNLENLVGYNVVGMAYPCGGINNDDHVASIIKKHTQIQYARTITSNYCFDIQNNLYRFNPTVFHLDFERSFKLAQEFMEQTTYTPLLFYIWGHSFEFDYENSWDAFEEFCKYISNRPDIFYGTNKEVLLGTSASNS